MIVHCSIATGITLSVGVVDVTLKMGRNEVADDFWAAWIKDHADFAPLVDGAILADPDAPAVTEEPATEAVAEETAPEAEEPAPKAEAKADEVEA